MKKMILDTMVGPSAVENRLPTTSLSLSPGTRLTRRRQGMKIKFHDGYFSDDISAQARITTHNILSLLRLLK